jgi:hypothetical protein
VRPSCDDVMMYHRKECSWTWATGEGVTGRSERGGSVSRSGAIGTGGACAYTILMGTTTRGIAMGDRRRRRSCRGRNNPAATMKMTLAHSGGEGGERPAEAKRRRPQYEKVVPQRARA